MIPVLNLTGRNRFAAVGHLWSDSCLSWTYWIACVTLHDCEVAPLASQTLTGAFFFAVCLTVFPFEFRRRTFTIKSELLILECSFPDKQIISSNMASGVLAERFRHDQSGIAPPRIWAKVFGNRKLQLCIAANWLNQTESAAADHAWSFTFLVASQLCTCRLTLGCGAHWKPGTLVGPLSRESLPQTVSSISSTEEIESDKWSFD